MDPGQRVRFTVDNLGAVARKSSGRFTDRLVMAGDQGTYDSPYTEIPEDDWHWVSLDDGQFVPVHVSQFETMSEDQDSLRRGKA